MIHVNIGEWNRSQYITGSKLPCFVSAQYRSLLGRAGLTAAVWCVCVHMPLRLVRRALFLGVHRSPDCIAEVSDRRVVLCRCRATERKSVHELGRGSLFWSRSADNPCKSPLPFASLGLCYAMQSNYIVTANAKWGWARCTTRMGLAAWLCLTVQARPCFVHPRRSERHK